MKDYKLFDIDYLINTELTEEDLYYIFETNSFIYSLIIGMFKEAKYQLEPNKIINICKENNEWVNKYFWTKEQRISFENKLVDIYKNVYQCSTIIAKSQMDFFIIKYGLSKQRKIYYKHKV